MTAVCLEYLFHCVAQAIILIRTRVNCPLSITVWLTAVHAWVLNKIQRKPTNPNRFNALCEYIVQATHLTLDKRLEACLIIYILR